MNKITPFLWFDTQAEEAARFYTDLFEEGEMGSISRYPEGSPAPAGSVMIANFTLFGQEYTALNGGPYAKFNEAVSFVVHCEDQAEVDRYWAALTDGGEEVQCGWLKDRYGLFWQIVPKGFVEIVSDPDPQRSARAMQAMMGMKKLDLDALHRAADGV